MKTDKHLYQIFEASPGYLRDLIQIDEPGKIKYTSLTLKEIAREVDGVLDVYDPPGGIYVTEWQFYSDPYIYNRVVISMAILQQQNPGRRIHGVVIFSDESLDPKTEPWTKVVEARYLVPMIAELEQRSPSHPLVSLFQPLIELDDEKLKQKAASCYNVLKTAIDPTHSSTLSRIFLDWMIQRFSNLQKSDIEKMAGIHLTPLEETRAYKEMKAICEKKGLEQGIKKGIKKGIKTGIKTGIETGLRAGQIQLLQQLLGDPVEKLDQLTELTADSLETKLAELQKRMANRN
jgi:predicted transposase YdaD